MRGGGVGKDRSIWVNSSFLVLQMMSRFATDADNSRAKPDGRYVPLISEIKVQEY